MEGFVLGISPCHNERGFTLLELVIIAAIIAIIVAIAIPQLLNARRSAWENRCKITLRSLGSAQLTYIETTRKNTYGTFEALQETEYISQGYTRVTIIDNYSLFLFDVDPPTMTFGDLPAYDSTFTIIAIPRSQRNKLRTFGINDKQALRVYTGRKEEFSADDGLENANRWQPLR